MTRLHEASDGAADIVGDQPRRNGSPETNEQRVERLADEAEFTRELDE